MASSLEERVAELERVVTRSHDRMYGLDNDTHAQYLNETRHDITARHGSSVVDHGSIGGLADDDHPAYPKGSIGYAEVTAEQTSISTETDLTGLSATVTVGATRLVRITAEVGIRYGIGETTAVSVWIKEGATYLSRSRTYKTFIDNERYRAIVSVVIEPSSGSHTYKLAADNGGGSNDFRVEAATNQPSFLLVEDIGPA